MVKISLEMVRKRAEHNEGQLANLEELSLHQQDIDTIDHIHRWCPRLRILYLQGNLIANIENLGRLRELEYLNLALNNVERVTGLEGCTALTKLDLTANFITDLTSLATLQDLPNLRQLFLTGNPCTDFRGYRAWVVCALPALQELDGTEVTRSGRLRALQELTLTTTTVFEDQARALDKREAERRQHEVNFEEETTEAEDDDIENEKWWKGNSEHTPEARVAMHHHIARRRHKHEQDKHTDYNKKKAREVRLFTSDGRPLNVNAAEVDFTLTEDEAENCFRLEVNTYKYLDASLVTCDVEPWYVKVKVRGKVLQLVLLEEVRPGQAKATRSQVTGHLIITMPKLAPPPRWLQDSHTIQKITPVTSSLPPTTTRPPSPPPPPHTTNRSGEQYLEVCEGRGRLDYANIVCSQPETITKTTTTTTTTSPRLPTDRPNSPGFVDDASVPPLE